MRLGLLGNGEVAQLGVLVALADRHQRQIAAVEPAVPQHLLRNYRIFVRQSGLFLRKWQFSLHVIFLTGGVSGGGGGDWLRGWLAFGVDESIFEGGAEGHIAFGVVLGPGDGLDAVGARNHVVLRLPVLGVVLVVDGLAEGHLHLVPDFGEAAGGQSALRRLTVHE